MKELSSLDLQVVSGGFTPDSATRRALGAISSTVGYMLAVQIKRIAGFDASGTIEGVTGANVVGGFVSHSMWDDQSISLDDRTAAGMAMSFLSGGGVGLLEDIVKTAISSTMQKN